MTQYEELCARIEKLENPMIYNYIDEYMPAWARPTVQRLVDAGYLQGDGEGLGLTDDMLRLLGEKGGVCGINFCAAFLRENSNDTTIEDIVTHARHIAKVAGVDALALGSDFDGIGSNLEFKDYTGMPLIADALGKHFTASEVDKISAGNALRVIRESMK